MADDDSLLTMREVLARVPVTRQTLWKWEARGEFPARASGRGCRPVLWRKSDVDAWIARRPDGIGECRK